MELTDPKRFFYGLPIGKIRARVGVSPYEEVESDRTKIRRMHDLDTRGFLVDVMSGAAHDDSPEGGARPRLSQGPGSVSVEPNGQASCLTAWLHAVSSGSQTGENGGAYARSHWTNSGTVIPAWSATATAFTR